jgi:thioredoxin reductase
LTLGRVRRDVLLMDSGEHRNASSPAMHNFLSRDGTPPAELRAIAHAELKAYATVRIRDGQVDSIRRRADGRFEVSLAGGETVGARRILLATGVRDEMPPIEGLGALWGRTALHCPYCHGYEVRDAPLAVLGGTPDRVRLALQLTRLSDDVVLCTHGAEPPLDAEARALLDSGGVGIRESPIDEVREEEGAEGEPRVRIRFRDGSSLERAAIFVQSRLVQRSPLAAELGCATFQDGSVDVNDVGQTTVPGVSAAGDMARRATMHAPAAAVVAAAASGAMAAVMLDQDLVAEEFGLPTPFPPRG